MVNDRLKTLILAILFPVVCYCQETDSISAIQDSLPKQNIVDRVMSLFEVDRGRVSVKFYPSMGLDPASGLALGAFSIVAVEPKEREKQRFYRPTSFSNMVTYSTKNWLNLRSDMMIYASHGIVVNTLLQYQISPDKYYGIGNDTLNTNPLKFDMNDFRVSGNISKELSSVWYIGFMFDISYRKYTSQGSNEKGLDLPEQKNQWLIGFGPHFTFDRRNNVNYPTKGEFVTLGIKYFAPHKDDAYSFYSVEFDARKYISLPKNFSVAMQAFSGVSDGDMPFYSMFQLGGQTRMRGISNKYMYIDKCAYYAQAELRKSFWKRYGIVIFGGFGDTYPELSEITFDRIKYVYGAGLRFQSDTKNKINLRLDYGRGSYKDSGFYMTVREAF